MKAAADMQQDIGQVYGINNQKNAFFGKIPPKRAPNVSTFFGSGMKDKPRG